MREANSPFELKSVAENGVIEGLAAGFGDVDLGGDKILFGAMTKTLADRGSLPLPMLLHHDSHRPIGAWSEWREERDGLHVKGQILLSSRDGQDAYGLVKMGGLTGISIGYIGSDAKFENGVRVLPEVKLLEASLVAMPMHERARVTAIKSIAGPSDIANLLRDAGLSGRQAKAAAGAAWKAISNASDDDIAEDEIQTILDAAAARIARL